MYAFMNITVFLLITPRVFREQALRIGIHHIRDDSFFQPVFGSSIKVHLFRKHTRAQRADTMYSHGRNVVLNLRVK